MVRIVSGGGDDSKGCRRLVAMDGDREVGFVSYREGSECKIDSLQVSDDAPEDTTERLVRTVMAVAVNRGVGSVSIHSSDKDGRSHRACRMLGFSVMDGCPCCQRPGAVCLKLKF